MSALAVSFGAFTDADFWIGVGVIAAVYGIFTIGLQLNAGLTGILNFGQAGFMAIGAYSMGLLVVDIGLSFWAALPVATIVAMFAGVIIGLPSLRLRAEYFAITTLAFAEIVRFTAQNARDLTGGNQGLIGFDGEWSVISFWLEQRFEAVGLGGYLQLPLLVAAWFTFGVLLVIFAGLQRTPWGRILRAVREDEDAASAVGKNPFSYKLQSLALAAGLGAIAGYFLALNLTIIYPAEFEALFTVIAYAILVLGGLASYTGVVAGAVLLWLLLEAARFVDLPLAPEKVASIRFMIVGLILILLMAFRPQGLFGKRQEMVLHD